MHIYDIAMQNKNKKNEPLAHTQQYSSSSSSIASIYNKRNKHCNYLVNDSSGTDLTLTIFFLLKMFCFYVFLYFFLHFFFKRFEIARVSGSIHFYTTQSIQQSSFFILQASFNLQSSSCSLLLSLNMDYSLFCTTKRGIEWN